MCSMSSLMTEYSLHGRDFLAIHPGTHRSTPCILARDKAILINLNSIRSIVTDESMIIFNIDNPFISKISRDIADYIRIESKRFGGSFPFELQALEGVLILYSDHLYNKLDSYQHMAHKLLYTTDNYTNFDVYQEIHPLKVRLGHLQDNSEAIAKCIQDIIASDEDMLELLLTQKNRLGHLPPKEMHLSVELLLENYYRRYTDVARQCDMHLEDIEGKQELAAISMDNYRNKILNLNLNLGIAEVSIALGTFFTSDWKQLRMSFMEYLEWRFICSCAMLYSFFQLRNRTMRRSPLKRENAAKYLSSLFRGIDNFDTIFMDYMSNTFPSEQESIRMTDFFKISSSILKRELSSTEKEQLRQLIPSSNGMVEKVTILSLIYRVSDRST
ncbi:inner membrane magnesium transporter MRS2 [Blastocystis sp. subtype 4]|uniref:inner membrane magnesium transporter MRS2 n=1 Tax=Blastocystis sp. subtype 4 TaxID=944170 RepID=UPI0007113439|nr:inner membrane magnesium transporter MRS2 [Blastocystis sp. subtype 4]KNB41737.1 inner membrane magnesium transporter MRS2 [Blastocystis sp. subtype 4]|eukprot:XP_014525180.1 inner membrane magnesium transporter MRS2 [Blastocystis sp. subtype 4]